MIDYQMFRRIHHLHERSGLSAAQIARETGLDPETVGRWLKCEKYVPRAATPRPCKLDPFKEQIVRLIGEHRYSAQQIFQMLSAKGYAGGYTQVKHYVRQIRPAAAPAYLTLDFTPGECFQWDWADCGSVPVGQGVRRLSAFLMVMCWSRYLYVEFVLRRTQEHFLSCHRHGLEFFGGVTARCMCDNDPVAVQSHERGCKPVLTAIYEDFRGHYGFDVDACTPGKGNEKGIVENAVRYLRTNFLQGRTLTSLSSANAEVRQWLESVANVRLHCTTRRRPLDMFHEEQRHLQPLPLMPYDCGITQNVRATHQFRVRFDANRYSVPAACASRPLVMRRYPEALRFYHDNTLVAEHVRSYEHGRDIAHPDHEKPLLEKRRRAREQQLIPAFLRLTPAADAYLQGMQARQLHHLGHVRKIMALTSVHGESQVARALEDALEMQAYGADYIASLLEQRQRLLPPAGPLHVPRNSDLLELMLPPPDLRAYEISDAPPHVTPEQPL